MICFAFFHGFDIYFGIFKGNVKNMRICGNTTVNRCITICERKIGLRPKIFKIEFSGTDRFNMPCRSLKTPFPLFRSARACSECENSLTLVGAKIGF